MKESRFTNADIPTQSEIDQYMNVAHQMRSRELRRQLNGLINAPRKLLGKSRRNQVTDIVQQPTKQAAA